ncbi:MAG: NAD(P)-dependent oxidoreductase [Alphaproteobacteria bacterium]
MPMQQFLKFKAKQPGINEDALRRDDWREVKKKFDAIGAEEQSSRCSQCGVPFCSYGCPLTNNIPEWLKLTAENEIERAWELAEATNSFPEICGRICPQELLCEGNCVLKRAEHGAVTIGAVEKYITDTAFENGWVKPIIPHAELTQSVGIIGAGPAGLAAAEQLRRMGYQVMVYDRYDRAGGLMIYGIPNFKLDKKIVERRNEWLIKSGVKFTFNVNIGSDITMEELQQKHDAILIATGVYKSRDLRLEGADKGNIVKAIDFLVENNRRNLGLETPGFDSGLLNAEGKHIVVLGAGDTAMDCCNTSWRQGAKSVTCMRRSPLSEIAGSKSDREQALQFGTDMRGLTTPVAYLGGENIEAVRITELNRERDANGRPTYTPIEGSESEIKADLVIKALGFSPENLPKLFNCADLETNEWGTVKIGNDYQTSMKGVFAAGDIARGASLVVWAILDGRTAAQNIQTYLANKGDK